MDTPGSSRALWGLPGRPSWPPRPVRSPERGLPLLPALPAFSPRWRPSSRSACPPLSGQGQAGFVGHGGGRAGGVREARASWAAAGIGCGLGRTEETGAFVRAFARGLKIPFVLDADGLFALGTNAAEVLRPAAGRCVLTPHPGEMARLLGTDTAWVQSHRLEAAKKAADDSGNVCVLKGARTVIAEPFGSAYINLTGNAGQAKGGSGDILTGIIAALLAQGLSPLSAALTGVWMHGKAADLACEGRAQQTLLATECLNCLSGVYLLLEDYRQREETQWI